MQQYELNFVSTAFVREPKPVKNPWSMTEHESKPEPEQLRFAFYTQTENRKFDDK